MQLKGYSQNKLGLFLPSIKSIKQKKHERELD